MDADNFKVVDVSQNKGADLKDDIGELFNSLVVSESLIHRFAAAGNEQLAIINLFITDFYPAWITFFKVTTLGFDEAYKTETGKFNDLVEKANADIKKFRTQKPTINDVWSVIDTFEEYAPHVKNKSMLTVNGS